VRVIVAARNEAARIGATLTSLRRALPQAELWVADDASRDGTAELARAAGAHVVSCPRHAGKGAAMSAAARRALPARTGAGHAPGRPAGEENGEHELFLLCDGDLGDCAGELAALVEAVRSGRAELAIAAFREREGGGFGLVRGFARWAIRSRCGLELAAPLSGQRALGGELLACLLPFAGGYGMELGMTIDAARAGARVVELELPLRHRVSGRTPAGFAHRSHQLLDLLRAYEPRAARGA
jgi:glycosyltransferase involved in cell wall biosynthesis